MGSNLLLRFFFPASSGLRLPEDLITLLQDARLVREPMDPGLALSGTVLLGPTSYTATCVQRTAASGVQVFEISARTDVISVGEPLPRVVPLQALFFEFLFSYIAAVLEPLYGYVVSDESLQYVSMARAFGEAALREESGAVLSGKVKQIYPLNFFSKRLAEGLAGLRNAGFRRLVAFPNGEAVASACDMLIWSDVVEDLDRVATNLGVSLAWRRP